VESLKQAIALLLRRLREQRLAVFVGAGVSATEAGLPSGNQLKSLLLSELGDTENVDENLAQAASRFEHRRDRPELYEFVKDSLQFKGDLDDPKTCPSYKLISRLPIKTILTTNFDNLIEDVFARQKTSLTTYRQDRQLANYKPNDTKLLKIHGDLNLAPDELVLTSEDYSRYLPNHHFFSSRIQTIFQDQSVVFLGYSLEDPDFRYIYEEVLAKVTTLKLKSFAIQATEPPHSVREFWSAQKVEIIQNTANAFLVQLHKAFEKESRRLSTTGQSVRISQGKKLQRPHFHPPLSSCALRKAFSYFVARQKNVLLTTEYDFCVLDTLQNAKEIVDPTGKVGHEVWEKTQEHCLLLQRKGFDARVLQPLDSIPPSARRLRIEKADFCIVIASSLSYESSLNRFYGPVANKKPILLFVHENLRNRVREDMVFPGLVHTGAQLTLFKRSELLSGRLWRILEQMLRQAQDQWLVKLITDLPFERTSERRKLSYLLGFDALLALSFMEKRKRANKTDLRRLLGFSAVELANLFAALENLHAVRNVKDSYEIRPLGRKVTTALHLYSFDFGNPNDSYGQSDGQRGTPRAIRINEPYIPKGFSIEGV